MPLWANGDYISNIWQKKILILYFFLEFQVTYFWSMSRHNGGNAGDLYAAFEGEKIAN